MAFQIIYLKATGRILRVGYFGDQTNLTAQEDVVEYADFTNISGRAVDPKTKTLVVATAENAYVAPAPAVPSLEDLWAPVRARRNELLAQTDFMMVLDYPITDANRAKVAAWRKSLRDITDNAKHPALVSFPPFPQLG